MTKQLVKVGAKWCGPCKMLDAKLDTLADDGSEFIKHRRDVDVDTPEGKAIQMKYGIRSVPVLMVLDSNGRCIDQLPPNSSLSVLKNFISQHDPVGAI